MSRSAPEPPRGFGGWRRALALAWVAAVVLLHLAAREFGTAFLP
ncbi:MAG: hypothetical protein VX546_00110 [Myxococcota bacterium]|nr:hypothetical protein [Myxococcota bacterium]